MHHAINEMLRLASGIGAMEYCHGIGVRLADLMKEDRAYNNLRLARRIKRALDPKNIMNPGKMALQ